MSGMEKHEIKKYETGKKRSSEYWHLANFEKIANVIIGIVMMGYNDKHDCTCLWWTCNCI